MSRLFSFQGSIFLAVRDAITGKPGKQVWVGNAPQCQVKLTTDSSPKIESFSGNRLQYGKLQKGKTAEVSLTLDEWTAENVALALYATKVAAIAGTVTGEVLPTGLVAGDVVRLDKPFVSSLVITDSAGTPATVPVGNVRLKSGGAGLVEVVAPGVFTQPFKAAYSNAASDTFTMFTAPPPERYLLLDGINNETNEPVVVELYRVLLNPVGQLDLINDDYGNLPMSGTMLFDSVNTLDANLGGFGRVRQKTAA